MKQFLVVSYDISNNKRRLKIAKTLEGYGIRCNFSVFECILTEAQITKMQTRLAKLCKEESDSILYYYLCKSCVEKREALGPKNQFKAEILMV